MPPPRASHHAETTRKRRRRRTGRLFPRGACLPSSTNTERNPMKLKNKVCIVTGAASGLGRGIAHTFAREGGKVVIADLTLAAAQATADEIIKAGGTAMAVAMDVTSEEQVNAGVAAVVAAYGGV